MNVILVRIADIMLVSREEKKFNFLFKLNLSGKKSEVENFFT